MSTFAYELYKRNVAFVGIGQKEQDDRVLTPVGNGGKTWTVDPNNKLTKSILCYYKEMPKFNFPGGFNAEHSELLQDLNKWKNMFSAGAKALPDLIAATKQAAGQASALTASGVAAASDTMFDAITDAMSKGYSISAVPEILRWGGQKPIDFKIQLIFLEKDGSPVYFDDRIKTLLSLVTFMDTEDIKDKNWLLRGPLGFNGTISKIVDLTTILEGKESELHSLILYKGDVESKSENIVKVLDLRNILVVTGVELKTSEQLYGSTEKDKGPAYKWITADVGFSTVCPLPSHFSKKP